MSTPSPKPIPSSVELRRCWTSLSLIDAITLGDKYHKDAMIFDCEACDRLGHWTGRYDDFLGASAWLHHVSAGPSLFYGGHGYAKSAPEFERLARRELESNTPQFVRAVRKYTPKTLGWTFAVWCEDDAAEWRELVMTPSPPGGGFAKHSLAKRVVRNRSTCSRIARQNDIRNNGPLVVSRILNLEPLSPELLAASGSTMDWALATSVAKRIGYPIA